MLGTSSKNVGHFSKNLGRFSKNVGDFPKNVGVFFQSPPREDFSQQIGTQKSRKWKSYKLRSSIFKY